MSDADGAIRLTIHLDGAVLWHHRPAYVELVHRAHYEGLAGASVFHGFTGFGAQRRIYRERPAHLAARGPCAVVLVDEEERLRCFLLSVQDVLEHAEAVAVLDRVRIHRSGARAVG
ncbi:DUF190 domain-containing protein [Streptomyces sp. NBC_00687]|uniref:DUF190 domain-containing protein n=1 Tax=Streptomyces sp. NBC_00687 TaxID=2975807 RepID=UPI002259486E|nr:DUF190 domain-containing protein [Streptomyces sp. NBC_00687]MCX4919870.1 DUF190 domain-containing protein [Streptomyces sp. NBC_00687]